MYQNLKRVYLQRSYNPSKFLVKLKLKYPRNSRLYYRLQALKLFVKLSNSGKDTPINILTSDFFNTSDLEYFMYQFINLTSDVHEDAKLF